MTVATAQRGSSSTFTFLERLYLPSCSPSMAAAPNSLPSPSPATLPLPPHGAGGDRPRRVLQLHPRLLHLSAARVAGGASCRLGVAGGASSISTPNRRQPGFSIPVSKKIRTPPIKPKFRKYPNFFGRWAHMPEREKYRKKLQYAKIEP